MKIIQAGRNDIVELYHLQLLSFESEAEMIGSREVPALQETQEQFTQDFKHWITLKMVNDDGTIVGAVRYRAAEEVVEVGRLMVHPRYRNRGLARQLLSAVDEACPAETKELYTCTKSWINIRLYEKMGYKRFKEHREDNGLSFVYMRKD